MTKKRLAYRSTGEGKPADNFLVFKLGVVFLGRMYVGKKKKEVNQNQYSCNILIIWKSGSWEHEIMFPAYLY